MSRVNTHTRSTGAQTHEGAPATCLGAEAQLRRSVLACLLWEREFYEDGEAIADRIAAGVHAAPLETAAEIALEARNEQYLRHVPLLIVREMARKASKARGNIENPAVVGDTLAEVIQRADELAEFLAIYWKDGKEPLAAQVKLGLARAFRKFDAYQLAKYDRSGPVRLRDVMFLVHPEPEDEEQAEVFRKIADDALEPPNTWEVRLSAGEDKKAVFEELLREERLGGLAFLRNLRNMEQVGVPRDLIKEKMESHPFSRVLPFRFLAAARFAPEYEPELERAMFRALRDHEVLPGKTSLLIDCSGSMSHSLSDRSSLSRNDAACALAMLLREVVEDSVDVIAFGSRAEVVPSRRGFGLMAAIKAAAVGHATNIGDAAHLANARGTDRVIVVTDEQSWDRVGGPSRKGYFINTASYENGVGYGPWTHIDGWSDSVVRFIQELERA